MRVPRHDVPRQPLDWLGAGQNAPFRILPHTVALFCKRHPDVRLILAADGHHQLPFGRSPRLSRFARHLVPEVLVRGSGKQGESGSGPGSAHEDDLAIAIILNGAARQASGA
jgi:hypothetical protein